jgi:hypothetical protein
MSNRRPQWEDGAGLATHSEARAKMTLQYPEATQRSSRNKKYFRDEQKMTSSTGIFNMLYVHENVKDPFSPHRRTGVLFALWAELPKFLKWVMCPGKHFHTVESPVFGRFYENEPARP